MTIYEEMGVPMPDRIRLSRAKGWRKPEGAVVVARPTLFGNPFEVGRHGTRAVVTARYALLMLGFVDLGSNVAPEIQRARYDYVQRNLARLRGRDLACWCSLDGPCHAAVLIELANGGGAAALQRFNTPELTASIWMHIDDLDTHAARAAMEGRR